MDRDVRRTAAVLLTGGMAVVFDTTIVAVALHALAGALHAPIATIQWVSTGYLLALAVTVPLVAWAQQRIGGKRLWLIALTLFLIGSVACSLAWDAPSLIAFRVVQGLGGGLLLPLVQTLIMQAAGGRDLGRTMAVVGLPAVLGPILGPVLGGAILHWLDWRWLFWVNVPFCVAGLILAARHLPADPPVRRTRLDVTGLVLLAPGLAGLLYGLSDVSRSGGFGRADVLAPGLAGLLLVAAFTAYALRRRDPLVDLRLLRRRPVAASTALLFLSGAALYGAMLLLPLFWQQSRGTSALVAGLYLAPQGLGTLASRSLSGRLTDSAGARGVALAGFVVVGLATVPFALAGAGTNLVWLMAVLVVRGFGLGLVTIPVMAVAFIGLERADVPHASIITRIGQQVGGSFGTALLAVILATQGFAAAFWWSTGFTAVAVALSLILPSRPAAAPAAERRRTPVASSAA
jgi:EmrB/QacA subfamily drug resistance transporter